MIKNLAGFDIQTSLAARPATFSLEKAVDVNDLLVTELQRHAIFRSNLFG
jgi:hypothetical protein